jgi:hypothetical protein
MCELGFNQLLSLHEDVVTELLAELLRTGILQVIFFSINLKTHDSYLIKGSCLMMYDEPFECKKYPPAAWQGSL